MRISGGCTRVMNWQTGWHDLLSWSTTGHADCTRDFGVTGIRAGGTDDTRYFMREDPCIDADGGCHPVPHTSVRRSHTEPEVRDDGYLSGAQFANNMTSNHGTRARYRVAFDSPGPTASIGSYTHMTSRGDYLIESFVLEALAGKIRAVRIRYQAADGTWRDAPVDPLESHPTLPWVIKAEDCGLDECDTAYRRFNAWVRVPSFFRIIHRIDLAW